MRIGIVGVGALGSHTAMLLRNMDATLYGIDFDRVERKNVKSQFHGKTSVGKLKVQGLKQTMNGLFGVKLDVCSNKLVADNVAQILANVDLVIDCLDNGDGRRVVQTFIREQGIACLHGALAADGTFGQVIWDEHFQIDDEDSEGAATCEDGEHLPFIAIASAFIARAVQEYIENDRKMGFQVNPGGVVRTH